MGNIYEQISKVMADVGAVGKDSTNQVQKYKFRGIDAVMNALHPAMTKHHVFVAPEVLSHEREQYEKIDTDFKTGKEIRKMLIYSVVTVRYHFYTDDGSEVQAVVMGEAMDSGDKSMNKAMSAAFKYACFQTFCIPTEEMKDSETDSPEPSRRVTAYPSREEMIQTISDKNADDPENLEKILKWAGKKDLFDMTDAQLETAYNKAVKK